MSTEQELAQKLGVPPVIIRALIAYRKDCFDDSEFGIGIDAFLSGNRVLLERAEEIFQGTRSPRRKHIKRGK